MNRKNIYHQSACLLLLTQDLVEKPYELMMKVVDDHSLMFTTRMPASFKGSSMRLPFGDLVIMVRQLDSRCKALLMQFSAS